MGGSSCAPTRREHGAPGLVEPSSAGEAAGPAQGGDGGLACSLREEVWAGRVFLGMERKAFPQEP